MKVNRGGLIFKLFIIFQAVVYTAIGFVFYFYLNEHYLQVELVMEDVIKKRAWNEDYTCAFWAIVSKGDTVRCYYKDDRNISKYQKNWELSHIFTRRQPTKYYNVILCGSWTVKETKLFKVHHWRHEPVE